MHWNNIQMAKKMTIILHKHRQKNLNGKILRLDNTPVNIHKIIGDKL